MTTATIGANFDMDRVLRRTFGVLRANLVTFGVITALLICLPQFLLELVQIAVRNSSSNPGGRAALGFLSLPIALIFLVGTSIAQAALTHGAISDLNGRPLSISQCLAKGAPHWWRLLLVFLFEGVLIILASIALFVPGLILWTRWAVAAQVQVVEGLGVRASLARSAALTKERRWAIFGLLITYLILMWILEAVMFGLAAGFTSNLIGAINSPISRLVTMPLLQLVVGPIGVTGLACIYDELRGGAVGAGPVRTAAIFD